VLGRTDFITLCIIFHSGSLSSPMLFPLVSRFYRFLNAINFGVSLF
jgi:hypothetical protein